MPAIEAFQLFMIAAEAERDLLGPYFIYKTGVAERMTYIHQLIAHVDDPEMLRWIRNRLSEAFGVVAKKLDAAKAENT